VDLPQSNNEVRFVYLSGDRLFTAADTTLYVYSMSDQTSHIATYQLEGKCKSGIIVDERLYLGGHYLYVFKVSPSLSKPLTPVANIKTERYVQKILRVGNELLLGHIEGYLQVVEMNTSKITHTHEFTQADDI
jgi:uncharacterized secreted protein with C-terminal beta-propeller domain